MQRTATHCNALQHTTTLCNTLQHIATHCNALPHTAKHFSHVTGEDGGGWSCTLLLRRSRSRMLVHLNRNPVHTRDKRCSQMPHDPFARVPWHTLLLCNSRIECWWCRIEIWSIGVHKSDTTHSLVRHDMLQYCAVVVVECWCFWIEILWQDSFVCVSRGVYKCDIFHSR